MGRTVRLTSGNDTFTQGLASANVEITLLTLGGDDTVSLNRVDNLGGGNRVETGAGNDAVVNFKEFGNIILLGSGNDTYVGRGFASFASDPFDQVLAGGGNDMIAVETFKSRYFGQSGNDTFLSVGWQNLFNGGSGVDTISYAPRGDDQTLGGTGVLVNLAEGFAQTGANRRETLISIENVTGSSGDDVLIGTNGANRLQGAGGFDELTGGGGADQFVFSRAQDAAISQTGFDLVTDFSRAQGDKIVLTAMDANTTADGNQAFRFIATAEFSGRSGQLRFDVLADGVMVSGDVNGDGAADFRFGLLGLASLRAADFLL